MFLPLNEHSSCTLQISLSGADHPRDGPTHFRLVPYITKTPQNLRFWDVENNRDLPLCRKFPKGYPRSWVEKRHPKLFAFARELGYWHEEQTALPFIKE